MRKLTEEEILVWLKQPNHRMFRYTIHARLLGMLLLIAGVSLLLSFIVWSTHRWDEEIVRIAIVLILGVNVMIWLRAIQSVWFVGRNYLGISGQELLIVQGKAGTALSFEALQEHNIDWHEHPPMHSTSVLPLHFEGKKYTIRLLSPYFSLEHFPAFLGLLLQRFDEHDDQPTI